MNKLKLIAILLISPILVLVPFKAYLQSTGEISGKVRISSGSALADVTVKATHNESKETKTVTTDDSGFYKITGLLEGTYTLNFTKEGFQRSQMRNVKVTSNQNTVCELIDMVWESITSVGDDLAGRELIAVARVAAGGSEYAHLQHVTARSSGFVSVAAIASPGATAVPGMVELRLNVTDYQDRDLRRRLDIAPSGGIVAGPTFLVYTGTEGGGMFSGNPFRVSEVAASRQWALMGFGTLNRAVQGQLATAYRRDEGNNYVVEVKFNPTDTVRFWINKDTFLISKVQTRYNSQVIVEEERSDYRRVSCMMLPFRIVTKLRGQRLADLTVDSYDLQTAVPMATFTISARP
jgi:hypothetical protein